MKNWQKFLIGALGAYFCFKWGSTYQAAKDSKSFMERTEEEKANDTMKIPYSRGLDVTVGPGKIEAKFSENLKENDMTVISTDEDIAGMSAKVVTDVISKNAWFDPYDELVLYYKALAGEE